MPISLENWSLIIFLFRIKIKNNKKLLIYNGKNAKDENQVDKTGVPEAYDYIIPLQTM